MLRTYDKFLRTYVFNPLFGKIQKIFHVNRWHLLIAVELIDVLFLAVCAAGLAVWIWNGGDGWLLLALAGTIYQIVYRIRGERPQRLREVMANMAEKFEEGRKAVPSEELLMHGIWLRRNREVENVLATGFLLTIPIEYAMHRQPDYIEMFVIAWSCHFSIDCIAGHLWDVDDIDPSERDYLLGRAPQPQTQNA